MSSSRSPQELRFLLDENVHSRLKAFLKTQGLIFYSVPKGATDRSIAQVSLKEGLVLVTNDSDFGFKTPKEVFSVVLLRVPQRDASALVKAFSSLLESKKSEKHYAGKLITLKTTGETTVPLPLKEA